MNVLIFGSSSVVSKILPQAYRLPTVLETQLGERFPDQEASVQSHYWGHLPESGIGRVLDTIERQRPDYLILAPTITWMTFTRADIAFRRWTPRRLHVFLERSLRVNRTIQRRLFLSRWPWLAYTYSTPYRILGNFLGAKPMFTVPEALAALDQVLVTAKRQEATEIIVLATPADRLRDDLAISDPLIQRAMRNPHLEAMFSPEDLPRLEEFGAGVAALCRQHRVKVVDIFRDPAQDIWQDGIHPGPETTRRHASIVCDAITELESAYGLPQIIGNGRIGQNTYIGG
jgi:hypothetical protein